MLGVKLGTITPEGTAGKSFFSFLGAHTYSIMLSKENRYLLLRL